MHFLCLGCWKLKEEEEIEPNTDGVYSSACSRQSKPHKMSDALVKVPTQEYVTPWGCPSAPVCPQCASGHIHAGAQSRPLVIGTAGGTC